MDLEKRALKVLEGNKKEGYSPNLQRSYFYIAPDPIHHHQWFWDSCFHIIVMSQFRPEWAWRELASLLSVQQADGFIPHLIFWKWRILDFLPFFWWWKRERHPRIKFITAEIQPPVIGLALEAIHQADHKTADLFPILLKVEQYFNYLKKKRDPDRDGLISIITPMESGMDFAPQFDIPLDVIDHSPRRLKQKINRMLEVYHRLEWKLEEIFPLAIFDFEDVGFNTIHALSLEALGRIWKGVDAKKARGYEEEYQRVRDTIIEKMWDEEDGIFYGCYHREGKEIPVRIKTISSLLPITLDLPKRYVTRLIDHITDEEEFWLPYPIPSVAKNEKAFGPLTNTRRIWRGTTWINTNWFIAKGLLRHGEIELYQRLKRKTLDLIERFGFCEFYDPFDGHPGRAERNFSWSTLAVIL